MTDGPEVEFVEGLAALLDSASIGVYSPGGVYAASDVGIEFGTFAQSPDQQIVLTTYSVQDQVSVDDSILGVNVMLRGTPDPRSVKNRSGLIFNQFQGLTDRWFGSMYLALMWRQSGRLDGKDDNDRWLSSENYYARVAWPTTYRPD